MKKVKLRVSPRRCVCSFYAKERFGRYFIARIVFCYKNCHKYFCMKWISIRFVICVGNVVLLD